jgi:hypothetical protein
MTGRSVLRPNAWLKLMPVALRAKSSIEVKPRSAIWSRPITETLTGASDRRSAFLRAVTMISCGLPLLSSDWALSGAAPRFDRTLVLRLDRRGDQRNQSGVARNVSRSHRLPLLSGQLQASIVSPCCPDQCQTGFTLPSQAVPSSNR